MATIAAAKGGGHALIPAGGYWWGGLVGRIFLKLAHFAPRLTPKTF